jgi:hypothetical protein
MGPLRQELGSDIYFTSYDKHRSRLNFRNASNIQSIIVCLALREEHGLMVNENRVLRRSSDVCGNVVAKVDPGA